LVWQGLGLETFHESLGLGLKTLTQSLGLGLGLEEKVMVSGLGLDFFENKTKTRLKYKKMNAVEFIISMDCGIRYVK